MSVLAATAISAALPIGFEILKDLGKAVIGRFIQKDKMPVPTSVDEYIKMRKLEIEMTQSLGTLDAVPEGAADKIWAWVINLRVASRYLLSWVVIVATIGVLCYAGAYNITIPDNILQMLAEMVASVWGFLFGDRIRVSWAAGKK